MNFAAGMANYVANKHVKGVASGYMYTYYILTLDLKRDLITENSGKTVTGYKNYSATINSDLSGDYISYDDLKFDFIVMNR